MGVIAGLKFIIAYLLWEAGSTSKGGRGVRWMASAFVCTGILSAAVAIGIDWLTIAAGVLACVCFAYVIVTGQTAVIARALRHDE